MFSTDKPITDASEDKLGRSGFAERLAKAIINFDTADSYAIALQGSCLLLVYIAYILKQTNISQSTPQPFVVSYHPRKVSACLT
mgnify:CR=1 FL=1